MTWTRREFVKQGLEQTSARTYNRLADLGLWEPLRRLPMNDELRLFHVPELGHLRPAWSAFTWTLQSLARVVAAADRLTSTPNWSRLAFTAGSCGSVGRGSKRPLDRVRDRERGRRTTQKRIRQRVERFLPDW